MEVGSFSKAAEREEVTVSAISQHMTALEKTVGIALFERHSRGVTPTEAGLTAREHADEIHDTLVSFTRSIVELKRGHVGTLVCGIFPTLATSLGPALLNSSGHPGVHIELRSARLKPLERMLKQRELDVAFAWSYPWSTPLDESFEYLPVLRDPTVMLVPESAAHTDWSDYMNSSTTWVTRSDSHQIGEVLDRSGKDYSFTPNVVYSANDWAEVQGMVEAGVGVALAPALATVPLRPGLTTIPVPAAPDRTIYLCRRRGQPKHPAEKILVQRLRVVSQDFDGTVSRTPPK